MEKKNKKLRKKSAAAVIVLQHLTKSTRVLEL